MQIKHGWQGRGQPAKPLGIHAVKERKNKIQLMSIMDLVK